MHNAYASFTEKYLLTIYNPSDYNIAWYSYIVPTLPVHTTFELPPQYLVLGRQNSNEKTYQVLVLKEI